MQVDRRDGQGRHLAHGFPVQQRRIGCRGRAWSRNRRQTRRSIRDGSVQRFHRRSGFCGDSRKPKVRTAQAG